jgi:hypothetical protein
MSEKDDWMKLDERGKQKHMGCDLTPQELLLKLIQGKAKKWEEKFRAAIKQECGGLCVLVCKQCMAALSANNPSKSFTSHKCSGAALAKPAAMRELGVFSDNMSLFPDIMTQSQITTFLV